MGWSRYKANSWANDSEDAGDDGEWRFNGSTSNITHMRGDGTLVHWDCRREPTMVVIMM